LPAVCLLWPRPVADPLGAPAARVCRAAAAHLRADASGLGGQGSAGDPERRRAAAGRTADASTELRRAFDTTPYRPTGLSTTSPAVVRRVDELTWLSAILADEPASTDEPPPCDPAARTARLAAADILDRAADLLMDMNRDVGPLRFAMKELRATMKGMEK